jgi:serine/threonine protein kinase
MPVSNEITNPPPPDPVEEPPVIIAPIVEVDPESHLSVPDEFSLAGYTYEADLGVGSSAIVLQMSKDGVSYAVKVCDLHSGKINFMCVSTRDPKEEAAILTRFNHPHVVKMIELIEDTDRDRVYIVMELCSRGTILNCETLDSKRTAFSEALSAINYLHFQRIAHRDIKPDNIMIHADGTVRLVDFGLALFVPNGQNVVRVEDVGTRLYFAPELFTATVYDPFAADIWSLGISLYAVLFGKVPFQGDDISAQQDLVVESEPEFPKEDEVDSDAIDLIRKMLVKDPKKRIQIDDIWSHKFMVVSRRPLRQSVESDSQIYKSLSSRDRKQSILRISRNSLRGLRDSGSSNRN